MNICFAEHLTSELKNITKMKYLELLQESKVEAQIVRLLSGTFETERLYINLQSLLLQGCMQVFDRMHRQQKSMRSV